MLARLMLCTLTLLLPDQLARERGPLCGNRQAISLLDQLGLPRADEQPAARAWLYFRRRQRIRAEKWARLLGVSPELVVVMFRLRDPRMLPPVGAPQSAGSNRQPARSTELPPSR
jgi:hypothetical protein